MKRTVRFRLGLILLFLPVLVAALIVATSQAAQAEPRDDLMAKCAPSGATAAMTTEQFRERLFTHLDQSVALAAEKLDRGYGQQKIGELDELAATQAFKRCTTRGLGKAWGGFTGRRKKACAAVSAIYSAQGMGHELDGLFLMGEMMDAVLSWSKQVDDETGCYWSATRGSSRDGAMELLDRLSPRRRLLMDISWGVVNEGFGANMNTILQARNDQLIPLVNDCKRTKDLGKAWRCSVATQRQFYAQEFPQLVSEGHRNLLEQSRNWRQAIELYSE